MQTPLEQAFSAIPGDTIQAATARGLMIGYNAQWCSEGWRTLDIESEFHIPIVNPDTTGESRTFTFAGKMDGMIQREESERYLLEHKTTSDDLSDPCSPYFRTLKIDGQVSSYTLASWLHGEKVVGTLYDVIRKPSIKPKTVVVGSAKQKKVPGKSQSGVGDMRELQNMNTYYGTPCDERPDADGIETYNMMLHRLAKEDDVPGTLGEILLSGKYFGFPIPFGELALFNGNPEGVETPYLYMLRLAKDTLDNPDKYFARRVIPRLDQDLVEFAQELWQVAGEIRDARRKKTWFRNSGACRRYGSICEYLPLCSGEDTADSENWEPRAEHKELSDDVGPNALTHSRVACFQTCRRLDYYKHEMRIQRVGSEESDAQAFGTLFHEALAAWWEAFRPQPVEVN